jgi:hypothetical protein
VRRALKEALAAVMQKHGLGSVEEEEGIKLSHHQKDVFHALQQTSIGFGCSNSWAPLLLKCVANCLLVDDPETNTEQTQYAGLINDGLLEFGSSVKELSCPVLEVELDTEMPSWMQHGVGGPAAKVLEPSAVRPAGKRSAPADSVMDHAETKNHCFLCSLNGQSPAECAIMAEDGTTYLNGHRKDRKAVVCEWFDSKFPAGDSERERRETARKAKYNALRSCRRAKKRPTGAAGGTG